MINVIVLWQTVYIQAALDHLAAKGYPIDPADVARLTPLGYPTINLDGRYRTTSCPPATGLPLLRARIDSGSCTNPRHRPYYPYQATDRQH
jgi:Tn3 transposase DDE domain